MGCAQSVEIRPQEERFLRLLEILGEWYERGKALIFVSSQEACDNLFRDLLKARAPLSLGAPLPPSHMSRLARQVLELLCASMFTNTESSGSYSEMLAGRYEQGDMMSWKG